MNRFYTDRYAHIIASTVDDVRLHKMILEETQMLATNLREMGATDEEFVKFSIVTKAGTPYKVAHMNHPCTIWARESAENFKFALKNAQMMCELYSIHYNKIHACEQVLRGINGLAYQYWGIKTYRNAHCSNHTIPPMAMPDIFKIKTTKTADENTRRFAVMESYRNYYISKMWSKGGVRFNKQSKPKWWTAEREATVKKLMEANA